MQGAKRKRMIAAEVETAQGAECQKSADGLCRNGCNCHACHTETEKRNKTTTRLITIPDDPPTLAIASAPTNCPTTTTSTALYNC